MLNQGIWTSTRKRLSHSSREAGISAPFPIYLSGDNYMLDAIDTNNGNDDNFFVGEDQKAGSQISRAWIKADLSVLSGNIISSIELVLTPITDLSANARTMSAHRCLRSGAHETQMKWTEYATGVAWGTAGASNSSTDYGGASPLGTMAVPASPTLNSPMTMELDTDIMQDMVDGVLANNGIILFVDTQASDAIAYASRTHATEAYRPYLSVRIQ